MSESQSRYSIVERLTQTKLDLIGAKSRIDEEIMGREQALKDCKQNLENWKKTIKETTAQEERNREAEIKRIEDNVATLKKRKQDEGKTYDLKIKAIDEALGKIEEISKASVAQSESPEKK